MDGGRDEFGRLCKLLALEGRVWGLGFGVWGFGLWVWGLRVQGLGFRAWGS